MDAAMGSDMLNISMKELLAQLSRNIPISENRILKLPRTATIPELLRIAAREYLDLQLPVELIGAGWTPPLQVETTGENCAEHMRDRRTDTRSNYGDRQRQMAELPIQIPAQNVPHFSPIRIENPTRLTPPPLASRTREGRERIKLQWEKYKHLLDRDPYAVSLRASVLDVDDDIPCLQNAVMQLSGIDCGFADPVYSLPQGVVLIWDTGNQITLITDDLIDASFLSYLRHEEYGYKSSDSLTVSIDARISVTNTTFDVSCIARVIPRERMPNQLSGVLLGQAGFINAMDVRHIPRQILIEDGVHVPKNVWGDIIVTRYITLESGALSSPDHIPQGGV